MYGNKIIFLVKRSDKGKVTYGVSNLKTQGTVKSVKRVYHKYRLSYANSFYVKLKRMSSTVMERPFPKEFHTHVATHIRTLACHARSLKYVFHMLHDALL